MCAPFLYCTLVSQRETAIVHNRLFEKLCTYPKFEPLLSMAQAGPPSVLIEDVGEAHARLFGFVDVRAHRDPLSWASKAKHNEAAPPPEDAIRFEQFITTLPFYIGRGSRQQLAAECGAEQSDSDGKQQQGPRYHIPPGRVLRVEGTDLTADNCMLFDLLTLSRVGCAIDWDPQSRQFYAQPMGSLGIHVNAVHYVAPNAASCDTREEVPKVPLKSGDALHVGSFNCYFLLPQQSAVMMMTNPLPSTAAASKAAAGAKRKAEASAAAGAAASSSAAAASGAASGSAPAKKARPTISSKERFTTVYNKYFASIGWFTIPDLAAMTLKECVTQAFGLRQTM